MADRIAVVRHVYSAAARGELDSLLPLFDPGLTWEEDPSLGPDAAEYHGLDEARAALASWMDMWRDYDFELVDVREAGDRVVALVRERAVGRASDAVLERELGVVYDFRGGTIARVRMFGSWEAALAAPSSR